MPIRNDAIVSIEGCSIAIDIPGYGIVRADLDVGWPTIVTAVWINNVKSATILGSEPIEFDSGTHIEITDLMTLSKMRDERLACEALGIPCDPVHRDIYVSAFRILDPFILACTFSSGKARVSDVRGLILDDMLCLIQTDLDFFMSATIDAGRILGFQGRSLDPL